jgi:2-phosphoglycerate kinase
MRWQQLSWKTLPGSSRKVSTTYWQNTMTVPKVIYIGGAPMVGKTTVATLLASRLGCACISTDDIGAAITAATDASTHPEFHYMGAMDYRDYYATTDVETLIRHSDDQHAALWPAIRALFQNHESWGNPIVIEGWALRPGYVAELSGSISGVFLTADDDLIEDRVRCSAFCAGAPHQQAILNSYLERSLRYNAELRQQVSELGLPQIRIRLGTCPLTQSGLEKKMKMR